MANNSPGVGVNFEVCVPAYFALILFENDDVADFSMQTNAQDYGKFDDLVLELKTRNGDEHCFAFQLKHKDSSLHPETFESSNHFKLQKYCKSYRNLREEIRQKFKFILYTNANFDPEKTKDVTKFKMEQAEITCETQKLLGTSPQIYRFQANETTSNGDVSREDYDCFFPKFFLYVNQNNHQDFRRHIIQFLFNLYGAMEIIGDAFISFVRRWHDGEFSKERLTKEMVQIQLIHLFSSNCFVNGLVFSGNTLLEEALLSFRVAVLENVDLELLEAPREEQISILYHAKRYNIVARDAKSLSAEENFRIQCYNGSYPLILKVNASSLIFVKAVLRVNEKFRNNLVLIVMCESNELTSEIMEIGDFFTNLYDLFETNSELYREICRTYQISLQGRRGIPINEIINDNHDISKHIKVHHLLENQNSTLSVGYINEKLPHYYVSRKITAAEIKIESLINLESDSVIINCDGKIEHIKKHLRQTKSVNVLETSRNVTSDQLKNRFIMLNNQEFASEELAHMFSGNPLPIHYLKALNESSFEWVATQGQQEEFCTFPLNEEQIFNNFSTNNINLICAQPGMGKTVMLEFLKKNCPPEYWALKVTLKEHNLFFGEQSFTKELILAQFLKKEFNQTALETELKHHLIERRKIWFFLDGLDEIQSNFVERAIECVKILSDDGFKVWISSRSILRESLESRLSIFALDIQQFDNDDQKSFIEKRLSPLYEQAKIEEITSKIYNNLKILNNAEILGVPLQLYMITEIFLRKQNLTYTFNDNMFIITNMYREFFEGKILHCLNRNARRPPDIADALQIIYKERFGNYLVAGLKASLSYEIYLDLSRKLSLSCEGFLDTLANEVFPLGIIVTINENRIPIFEHTTHGEFFAALWFAGNYRDVDNLKEFIFLREYRNVTLMMDMILAEESQAHIAVLYNDLNSLKRCTDTELEMRDKAGRSVLHLAATSGEIYPILKLTKMRRRYLIDDKDAGFIRTENFQHKLIILFLLNQNFDPLEEDDYMFHWNSIQYADACLCLYSVEKIFAFCEKNRISINLYNFLNNYSSFPLVIYYSARFSFMHLFKVIISSASRQRLFSTCFPSSTERMFNMVNLNNESLLHIATEAGQSEVVRFLIDNRVDIDKIDNFHRTPMQIAQRNQHIQIQILLETAGEVDTRRCNQYPLHWAASNGNLRIIELLLSNRRNEIDELNDKGETPLHQAALQGQTEIVHHLLNRGANIDFINPQGESALLLASYGGNLETVKALLRRGANLNFSNKRGWRSIHCAACEGCIKIIEFFVKEHSIDVDAKTDQLGQTPLHLAIQAEHHELVKYLLDQNADVRLRDKRNWEALHYASAQGDVDTLRLLIRRGARRAIDKSVEDLFTPLDARNSTVIHNNYVEDIEILKQFQKVLADDCENFDGIQWTLQLQTVTPLALACFRGKTESVKFLINGGARVESLAGFCAASAGRLEILKILLKRKPELVDDCLVLNLACLNSHYSVVEYLLTNVDVERVNTLGQTALHFASYAGNVEILELLVNNGGSLKIGDGLGWTCLHYAVHKNRPEAVEFLLKAGVSVNAVNQEGKTALHLAKHLRFSNLKINVLLLKHGADPNIKDKSGMSPIDTFTMSDA